MSSLIPALKQRYPNTNKTSLAIREQIKIAYTQHVKLGLADRNIEQRICHQNNNIYWQQLSEIQLGYELVKVGLTPTHKSEGPDFLIEHNGLKIWIEVICPEPAGLPDEWTNRAPGGTYTFPHEAILLRWTAAIKEKAEKLLGNPQKKIKGYLQKGIVAAEDAYVIAINSRLLRGRGGAFSELTGISQLPFAVEATLCVGPLEIKIDRKTLKATESAHQHRPLILKPNGAQIPADTFLDPKFSPISAIWAVDIDERSLLGSAGPMIVVHNPNATNHLPEKLLPAYSEYLAMDQGDHYILECRER